MNTLKFLMFVLCLLARWGLSTEELIHGRAIRRRGLKRHMMTNRAR